MLSSHRLISGILFAAAFALSTQVQAGDMVPGDKLSSLVMGKTIRAKHLKKGFEFSIYFDKDGKTAFRKQGSDITQTTYRIDGNQHCIFWKGKDRCAQLLDNGDGTYSRVNKKGKQVVKWMKLEDGKKL